MSIDLSSARAAYAAVFFADDVTLPPGSTLPVGTVLADGTVISEETVLSVATACKGSFGIRGSSAGRTDTRGDLLRERGAYMLDLLIGTIIPTGKAVRYAGRVFTVIWTPPVSALDLAQSYGLQGDQ